MPVILTILCPLLGLPIGLSGIYKYKGTKKRYAFCLALFFATLAYCALPYGNTDLTRYWHLTENISRRDSLFDAIQNSNYSESGVYSFVIYSWIIGRIGDLNLLQYISTFFVYYIAFYITCTIAEDTDIDRQTLLTYLLIIIVSLNLYGIINNVRNVFGFSLISLAVFRDVYQNKKNLITYFLYLFSIFLHSSVALLLILRLILLNKKRKNKIIIPVILMLNPLTSLMYNVFYSKISGGNIVTLLMKTMLKKGNSFFSSTTDNEWVMSQLRSVPAWIQRFSYVIFTILIILILFFSGDKQSKSSNSECFDDKLRLDKITDYVKYLSFITLSSATMLAPEYWRFVSEVISLGAIVIFPSKKICENSSNINRMRDYHFLLYLMLLIAFLCMIMWSRNMRLMNLSYMIQRALVSSPIIIVLRLL